MSESRVVANFVDYCNLLEQARLDGYMLIDVGVIAARLIHSAIEFYNRADTDVRERLDKCFSRVFDQNTFLSVSHIND